MGLRDIRGVVRWALPLALLLPALVAAVLLARRGPAPDDLSLRPAMKLAPSESPSPSTGPGIAPPSRTETPGGATRVQVGIYLNKIQSIDLAENAYTVDFYLWMQWTGDLDASATLDFVNEDAKAFPRSRPFYEQPKQLADGRKYQGWHMLSTFKSLFNFADYPRDRHVLSIDVEDNTHDASSVVYSVAKSDVQYDTSARNVLGGWRMAIFVALLEAVLSRKLREAGRISLGRRLDLWVGIGLTAAYVVGTALIALV